MNILIADDDHVHVQMLTAYLRKTGYGISAAYDAIQAFTTALRCQPGAILLDVNMPGGTGIEVLRRLKNSSRTAQIPVIVVSGSIGDKTVEVVKQMGGEEYLRKPVDLGELLRALHRVLGTPEEVPVEIEK
jgi:CheY-like chemotaxis protein